jgi:hypothetical protein
VRRELCSERAIPRKLPMTVLWPLVALLCQSHDPVNYLLTITLGEAVSVATAAVQCSALTFDTAVEIPLPCN